MAIQAAGVRLYATLCRVLDSLRGEAPASLRIYNPPSTNAEAIIQARSRALLHLFLKSRFGLLRFDEREFFVTDGRFDGGIDAFYIDKKAKKIYLCQSKFRASAKGFSTDNMTPSDLLKMEVGRIVRGEKKHENGDPYNNKITNNLQRAIRALPDVGAYTTHIVLLGNSKTLSKAQLHKLVEGFDVDQFPHERIYEELLFPVISGTYFSDPNLTIEINLANVTGDGHLDYNAKTASLTVNVKLIFVPTLEIGRIMFTYKNFILKFNPRSFLELSRNPVNQAIQASLETTKGNEFALFNNGLTIIADSTEVNSNTARLRKAQVVLLNPQLVNGGQTAFTLARVYERCVARNDFKTFKGKEVLLRIITLAGPVRKATETPRMKLVGDVSKASNSQTKIEESDRRANDHVQVLLQAEFFRKYGLYYERKRGEFSDGIHSGYVDGGLIINRERLVRVSLACAFRVNQARSSIGKFFQEDEFASVLRLKDIERYAYGYEVLENLDASRRVRPTHRGDRYHMRKFGQALRYGQYAVVAVCVNLAKARGLAEDAAAQATLSQWKLFETWAEARTSNRAYQSERGFDFVNYYKGSTINDDLQRYRFRF